MSLLCRGMSIARRLPSSFRSSLRGCTSKAEGWTLAKECQIVSVCRQTPVDETCKLMVENKIGAVMVMDGENIAGIFTDRDAVYWSAKDGVSTDPVERHMTSLEKFITVTPQNDIKDMMNIILEHNVRHIPMVDRQKREMLRMISIKDVVSSTINELQQEVKELQWFMQL